MIGGDGDSASASAKRLISRGLSLTLRVFIITREGGWALVFSRVFSVRVVHEDIMGGGPESISLQRNKLRSLHQLHLMQVGIHTMAAWLRRFSLIGSASVWWRTEALGGRGAVRVEAWYS